MPTEESLFADALALADPDDRRRFLDAACGPDTDLRARVEAFLAAHEQSRFSEAPDVTSDHVPTDEPTVSVHRPALSEGPGTMIGPYKLLQQIGEGGMGTVFMAEQERPVRRKVALKVIKPGMDTKQVLARFEAERQALAIMDHPNIARVLDVGATDTGRPFFVMELVKGVPITEYCDRNQLTPKERLELFIPVCQAIQHAHQKGIIHRDIKPSNVLVTLHDGAPVPKVIDFGVAKAIDQRLTERTMFTEFGAVLGTLEYMSPEQAEMGALDIDTRSDIYSLGVLLYELLTGSTPLERAKLRQAAYAEVLRRIREEEPTRPSTRLSESKGALPSISAQRKMEPARLTKLVRGDLDWIVMKSLEKDRTRRYETATGFARDIRRYLDGDPVEAGPPSATYRLGKFARKHRAAIAVAAAFALVLIAATAISLASAHYAKRSEAKAQAARAAEADARRRTRATLDAMTDDVIEQFLGRQSALTKAQKEFLRKVQRSHEEFAAARGDGLDARIDRANGLRRVAMISRKLGDAAADSRFAESIEQFEAIVAQAPESVPALMGLAAARHEYARVLVGTGRAAQAEVMLRSAMADYLALSARVPSLQEQAARAEQALGVTQEVLGRVQAAEETLRSSRARLARLVADNPTRPGYRHALARVDVALGGNLARRNQPIPAEAALLVAATTLEQLQGEDRDDLGYAESLAMCYTNLGFVQQRLGRRADAESTQRKLLVATAGLAAGYPTIPAYRDLLANAYNNLALCLDPAGPGDEREALLNQALEIRKRLAADFPNDPEKANNVAGSLVNLANRAIATKDPRRALGLLEQAIPYHRSALRLSPTAPEILRFHRNNLNAQVKVFLDLKDHRSAAARADDVATCGANPAVDQLDAAQELAECAALALKDDSRPEDERKAQADGYTDRAAHWIIESNRLKPLDAKGFGELKADPNLAPAFDRDAVKAALARPAHEPAPGLPPK